ncbi:hypothetical protein ACH4UM_38740 [Streptomyces sp. NPDC020801]|uniref:hypothetical protein n=1 Tax=unclassified Streptomyces TaxID=2593676 RepID=UPI0037AB8E08
MDLDAVADELYGLRPEEFTAVRDARAAAARGAGDRALARRIGALRRPSLAAWAANLLVRERPEEIEPLLRLGEGLRRAHRDLDGAQLRELGRRQRVLVSALSRQAGQLTAEAGHPIGEAARREVANTLHAVLADPAAAREWAAGRLVRPFEPATGFPGTAEGAAGNRPSAPPAGKRPAPTGKPSASAAKPPASAARRGGRADAERRGRLTRAREEARDAGRELAAREREARTARSAADAAGKRAGRLRERVGELTRELERVEGEHREAHTAEKQARDRMRTAERAVREAGRRAETAAARAERLAAEEDDAGRRR